MSRNLDALVMSRVFKQKVLGWAPCFRYQDGSGWGVTDRKTPDCVLQPVYAHANAQPVTRGEKTYFGVSAAWLMVVPHYSTEIAVAWQLWDIQITRGRIEQVYPVRLEDDHPEAVGSFGILRWVVVVTGMTRELEDRRGILGSTAEQALCKAALTVSGVPQRTIDRALAKGDSPSR